MLLGNHFSELIKHQIDNSSDLRINILDWVDYVVPVPLHKKRLRKREYNQSLILASSVSKHTGIGLLKNCLLRVKTSVPQSQLPRKERFKNVKNVFDVAKPAMVNGKILLLVDDIFTTGATINECSKVLLKAGAKEVRVLTLSRAIR